MTHTSPKAVTRAWLCFSTERSELGRLGQGYEEVLGEYYTWDDTVNNSKRVAEGDILLLWNRNDGLLGFSVVEEILVRERVAKVRPRCPRCNATDVRRRRPPYRCGERGCNHVFSEPVEERLEVTQYIANYAAGWTMPRTPLSPDECRQLATRTKSQLSIREVDLAKLDSYLAALPNSDTETYRRRDARLQGGHRLTVARVRIGQESFRRELRRKYGSTCAVTGETHEAVLEAAHLYRFAESGEHHEDGGLLLRRDVHALFDRLLVTVNPESLEVVVDDELKSDPYYSSLHGAQLKVSVPARTREWLALHYEQFVAPRTHARSKMTARG
jgi:hypothetical protein